MFFSFFNEARCVWTPLEAILVIFGRRALIFFFCLEALENIWKWYHFCAHAEWWSPWRRKNVKKKAPRFIKLNFLSNCDGQKRFSQNERRTTDLQNFASDFLLFAPGLSYALSKSKKSEAMNMMNKCAKFHKDSPSGKKVNSISRAGLNFQRRLILCTTLYRNLMQAGNFGCTFNQLFIWIFYALFTEDASTLSLAWCKKWPKTQINGVLPFERKISYAVRLHPQCPNRSRVIGWSNSAKFWQAHV